jgi:hypothetical protein
MAQGPLMPTLGSIQLILVLSIAISHASSCSNWLKDGHKTQIVHRRVDSRTFVELLRKSVDFPMGLMNCCDVSLK